MKIGTHIFYSVGKAEIAETKYPEYNWNEASGGSEYFICETCGVACFRLKEDTFVWSGINRNGIGRTTKLENVTCNDIIVESIIR